MDCEGKALDSSEGSEPFTYLHEAGNIVPGWEKALVGKAEGDSLKIRVELAEGFGERRGRLISPKNVLGSVGTARIYRLSTSHKPMDLFTSQCIRKGEP